MQADGRSLKYGVSLRQDGAEFTVISHTAGSVDVCVYEGEAETLRHSLKLGEDGVWSATLPGVPEGTRYGFRADGPYDPANGLWFDPDKLLVDPYAVEIDRPYVYDPRLAARRAEGGDTAPLVPKAIVRKPLPSVERQPPVFKAGGLIYELNVRAFTKLHPEITESERGTIAALRHPSIIAHMKKLGVDAIELMPITATIDERHLPPLGLTNAWGYNPVTFMALDPSLAPGGIAELRETVAALRLEGIGVILDLVFNHTGESDALGPTLSLRGLDAQTYFRHGPGGVLVNDTGCGNTIACDRPPVRRLILDALRHFVTQAGVDGFRFDLAPILGRTDHGFDPNAELLREMTDDPVLGDRVLIAEPWDIGPGGYQLGRFPKPFLEWNDRYRDDVRRWWRGEGNAGALATRLAGSSDVFAGEGTRTVNFIAAHDGMTLADLVAYERKHNEANGEANRDGHDDNLSWNNGVEGATGVAGVLGARASDRRALSATLFASRGAIMLTAGDEFGRTQRGNNNAYAQDNDITWVNWAGRDLDQETYAAKLTAIRRRFPELRDAAFFTGEGQPPDVEWLRLSGEPMTPSIWNDSTLTGLAMVLRTRDGRLAVAFNRGREDLTFAVPGRWTALLDAGADNTVAPRSVGFFEERRLY